LLVVEFTSLSVKLAHNRRKIESTFVDYLVDLAIARWLKALLVNIARHQPEVKSYRDQIGLRLVGLLLVGSVGHELRFDSYLYGFAGCSRFLCQLAVS